MIVMISEGVLRKQEAIIENIRDLVLLHGCVDYDSLATLGAYKRLDG